MDDEKGSLVNPEEVAEKLPGRSYARIFRPGLLLRPLAINGADKIKRSKRMWIILVASLLIISAAAALFLTRSRSLRQEAQRAEQQTQASQLFISQSRPIATSLVAEVENIYQNNFLQLGNTTKNYDEAKNALAQRISDLQSSKSKIAHYESEYRKLKPNTNNKDLENKLSKMFELANAITTKYEASLNLRDKTLQAYNEPLNELTKYGSSASKGEERTVLIEQTSRIINLAQSSLDTLGKLVVGPDDNPLHDLRMEYLHDIKTTFAKLNGYYRDYQPDLITAELEQFNSRNVQRNDNVAKITNDYITSSPVAQDFTAFKQSAVSL